MISLLYYLYLSKEHLCPLIFNRSIVNGLNGITLGLPCLLKSNLKLMLSELSRVMRIQTDGLKPVVQRAAHIAAQEVESKKRKLTHARRGCECQPEKGCKMGPPGRDCKCIVGGIACDHRCDCGGKCANPKNIAETEDETDERELWTAGKLNQKEQEIEQMSKLAARAAAAAAAMDIDTPPKRG